MLFQLVKDIFLKNEVWFLNYCLKFKTILNLHEQENIPLKFFRASTEREEKTVTDGLSRGLCCHLGDLLYATLHPPFPSADHNLHLKDSLALSTPAKHSSTVCSQLSLWGRTLSKEATPSPPLLFFPHQMGFSKECKSSIRHWADRAEIN